MGNVEMKSRQLGQEMPSTVDGRTEMEKRLTAAGEISERLRITQNKLSSVISRLAGEGDGEVGDHPKPVRAGLLGRLDDAQEESMKELTVIEGYVDRLSVMI